MTMLNHKKGDEILAGKQTSKYSLLRDKGIIAILDGDTDFGEIQPKDGSATIRCAMPYLSGPELCEISTKFGLPATYGWNGGALSRWAYLDNLIEHCIANNRASDLLAYLFSKGQFVKSLKGHTPEVIEKVYEDICNTTITQINGILYFGGNELIISGKSFIIHEFGSTVEIAAPVVKSINRTYISEISQRALADITDGYFDSAITKSRTLLEEVFIYVIEKKGEEPSVKGDIGKLYGQVKQLYNMHQIKEADIRINTLLSGLEKILSAIAEMRNANSDAHGAGAKRINLSDYHTRLFVNSATTMADFILSVGGAIK